LQPVDRGVQGGNPGYELSLNLLQLADVEQARTRGWRPDRGRRWEQRRMPGFELAKRALQCGNLGAKLVTTRCLRVNRMTGTGRRNVESSRDSTGVHTCVVGFAGGVGGDAVNGRRRLQRSVGDERAGALAAEDHSLALKALVDGADGVGVDVQRLGKVA
jgi:hypothetical protein